MRLAAYLELSGKGPAAFAAEINVSAKAVSHWIGGKRIPRPEQMQKIIDATKGAVTPNDFLQIESEHQQPFREGEAGEGTAIRRDEGSLSAAGAQAGDPHAAEKIAGGAL